MQNCRPELKLALKATSTGPINISKLNLVIKSAESLYYAISTAGKTPVIFMVIDLFRCIVTDSVSAHHLHVGLNGTVEMTLRIPLKVIQDI